MSAVSNKERYIKEKIKDAIKGFNGEYNDKIESLLKIIDENNITIDGMKNKLQHLENKSKVQTKLILHEKKNKELLLIENYEIKDENQRFERVYGKIPIDPPRDKIVINPLDYDANIFDHLIKHNHGNNYNDQQIEAIRYDMTQNLRIIAGAGSGKTQTICAKAAYLVLSKKAKDTEIIMCTFTKKAKKELRDRMEEFLGDNKIGIHTFHSWFSREHYNLKKIFEGNNTKGKQDNMRTEDGEEDNNYTDLFNGLVKEFNLCDFDLSGDKPLKDKISYWINMGFNDKDMISFVKKHYDETNDGKDDSSNILSERFKEFLAKLDDEKIKNGIVSFDDCLLNIYKALVDNQDILAYIQKKYKYIFIDEFQDINPLQMEIIKLICPPDKNRENKTKLIIVGDDDQSIYYFRGAEPKFIKKFDDSYNTFSLKLMTNYRSMANIVQAGNCVINNNIDRIKKIMISNNRTNGECYIVRAEDTVMEADWIINKAIELGQNNVSAANEPNFYNSVILCPSELQITTMVQRLRQRNIPFVVISDNDLLGVFKIPRFKIFFYAWKQYANCNPDVERACYIEMVRILCNAYYVKNEEFKQLNNSEITDEGIVKLIKSKYKNSSDILINNYLKEIRNIKTNCMDFNNIINVFKDSPVNRKKLTNDQMDCIVNELIAHKKWKDLEVSYDKVCANQRNQKKLIEDYENKKYNAICIMTIHKSKGLGFEHVFLKGIYQDSLPNYRVEELGDYQLNELIEKAEPATTMEEQRRLMYVAITRAKKNLYITFPKEINNKSTMISRFLKESNIPILNKI